MHYGILLHLSFNMWGDADSPRKPKAPWGPYSDSLQCDTQVWGEITKLAADSGLNQIVIDVGDAVAYQSHPEIAVRGAWSPSALNAEVLRLRGLGFQVVPKLNFGAAHDMWLGEYQRMVSTQRYYEVCRDLISEVVEIFDGPDLFHLGMDEETAGHQQTQQYVVVRQGELWWHDLCLLVEKVEACGAQAWVWADHAWRDPDAYLKKMPKSVLQSNWYYAPAVGEADFVGREYRRDMLRAFETLEAHGFDQEPCGANWDDPVNLPNLVDYCATRISLDHLKGFLQTTWLPTIPDCRDRIKEAVLVAGEVARAGGGTRSAQQA